MTEANETLQKLAALCEAHRIELSLAYATRTVREQDVWNMFKNGECPQFVWTYTVNVNGRAVRTGTYSAGYGKSIFANARKSMAVCQAIAEEISTGKLYITGREYQGHSWHRPTKPYPIEPMAVMACLLSDAGCVDGRTFDDFCSELGYDSDSIKAKGIYDTCVETYMVLKAALGSDFSAAYEIACEY